MVSVLGSKEKVETNIKHEYLAYDDMTFLFRISKLKDLLLIQNLFFLETRLTNIKT